MSDMPIVLFNLTTSLYFPKQDSMMSELQTTCPFLAHFNFELGQNDLFLNFFVSNLICLKYFRR